MEMILGVIEDLLDRYETGTGPDKEDALAELKLNYGKFKTNLEQLVTKGNAGAKKILDRLSKIKL